MDWFYQKNEIKNIKYINTNNINNKLSRNISQKYISDPKKQVNMYLFFDLLQICHQIITMTTPKSIFILVGETPSYLYPFLRAYPNKLYILNSSNKPYSLVDIPHSNLTGVDCSDAVTLFTITINKVEKQSSNDPTAVHDATLNENYYFEYLNTKTFLTRTFVKDNWKDIILIDYSIGPSISGVSIFFNRYVANIISDEICDINGSVPMKFINLAARGYINVSPELSESMFEYERVATSCIKLYIS
jgi:hypothetical protein